MVLHKTTDAATIATIQTSPRVLVFLSVPWSGPARFASKAFLEAVSQLESDTADLGVSFFFLDEDAKECRNFVASLGLPILTGAFSLGAGSLLWLEQGKVVAYEIRGLEALSKGIVEKTIELWDQEPQQTT